MSGHRRWDDQAAGLRQLVAPPACRSISLTGGRGGAGVTTLLINLAAALAERARTVMVLDEYAGQGNVCHRLKLTNAFDFEQVLRREVPLAGSLVESAYGFAILPVAARTETLARLNDQEQTRLALEFELLTEYTDYLLLDARPATTQGIPSLSLAADDVVVVVSNRAESLTDAYATIKQLASEYARRDFRILINRVASLGEAITLFERVRQVAHQYLGRDVNFKLIGYVPEDEWLSRATRLGRTVLDAFPECESTLAIRQLADAMLGWHAPRQPTTTAGFVYRMIESSRILSDRMHNEH